MVIYIFILRTVGIKKPIKEMDLVSNCGLMDLNMKVCGNQINPKERVE